MFNAIREAKGRMQIGPLVDQIAALLKYNDRRLTPGQWDDPYLYGYFSGAIGYPLKIGKLTGASSVRVQAWGWERLTGIAAVSYPRRILGLIESGDADYFRGTDAGVLWGALVTGTARRDHPAVQEAVKTGRLVGDDLRQLIGGEANDLQDAAAFVMTRDFYNYLIRSDEAA